MKKKVIIISFVLLVLILGIILIIRKPQTTQAPTSKSTILENIENNSVNCADDSNCLLNNLLSCHSAIFSKDFTMPGSKYFITIYGKEDDKCHFDFKTIDAEGSLLVGSDCQIPMTSLTTDTFKHLFGLDTGKAKEIQNTLYNTYCTDISQK